MPDDLARRPYVRPEPTTMPGDLEPRERFDLPTARVHGAGARWLRTFALAMILPTVVAICMSFGTLLSRIDTARAEAQRAYAHTAVLRVELEHVRATMPKPGAVDEVCRRRTVALRGALLALVRLGKVSMTGNPGGEWIEWR